MLQLNNKKGFTLVEIMIATMLSSFIMLVAVGALRAITATSERIGGTIDTAAEVRFAAKQLETDLLNIYRDSNSLNRRLIGGLRQNADSVSTNLLFWTIGRTKARFDLPEGDLYEVEYFLLQENEQSKLCRRLWPNPEKDILPTGILTELVENIREFQVRYFDGTNWTDIWDSDGLEMLPDIIEVTLVAVAPFSNDIMTQTIVVNLKSNVSALGTIEAIEQAEQVEGTETEATTGTTSTTGISE